MSLIPKPRFLGLLILLLIGFQDISCVSTPEIGRPESVAKQIPVPIPGKSGPDIPLVINHQVQRWIEYYQGRGRVVFRRHLERSGRYIEMKRRLLWEKGLPADIVYLSLIESGFNAHAVSHARATGSWQFMYGTGKRYGLKVDDWIDERRDPVKATLAAAAHLKDLHNRFGDWYLAFASYNAGEGKVSRAIRRYHTTDYWQLIKGNYLRKETRDYVPKYIAAALIARNPERYGYQPIDYEKPVEYDEVKIDSTDLRVVARCAETSYEEIRLLNPELLYWTTPPDRSYPVKVPKGKKELFSKKWRTLSAAEKLGDRAIVIEKPLSLKAFAEVQKVPVELLALANHLPKTATLKKGQQVTLLFGIPDDGAQYQLASRISHQSRGGGGKSVLYTVRRGDNTARIAKRVHVDRRLLQKYNRHIRWNKLVAGRKIRLYLSASRNVDIDVVKKEVIQGEVAVRGSALKHRVKRGQTLSEISQTYDVSVAELKKNNALRTHRLKVGQVLVVRKAPVVKEKVTEELKPEVPEKMEAVAEVAEVPAPVAEVLSSDPPLAEQAASEEPVKDPNIVYYKVQKGDTLKGLAQEYGVSEEAIRVANQWSSRKKSLRRGRTIRIPVPEKNVEGESVEEDSVDDPSVEEGAVDGELPSSSTQKNDQGTGSFIG